MPLGSRREKVLYGLAKKRARHRYTTWRWAIAIGFTLAVALLPLTGALRFDLWGGHHRWLGRTLDLPTVAKHFAFPFLAVNVVILVVSRVLGRYLCGFVCPVGAIARMAEWLRWHDRTPRQKLLGTTGLLAFCAALAAITFSFWVDWRVFLEGSGLARSLSALFLVGTTAVLFVGARRLGLRFCRDFCPSGVYFAILGHESMNGVEFAHPETCTECGACEKVCPMDLLPKAMSGGEPRGGSGFYPDALSNFSLCIRCGDCVKVCEATTERSDEPTPLRMGFLPPEHRQALPPEEGPSPPSASTPPSGEAPSGETPTAPPEEGGKPDPGDEDERVRAAC